MHPSTRGRSISRVWLYSDQASTARVVEYSESNGSGAVEVEGPARLRGRHEFSEGTARTAFLVEIDRQLVAAGFVCLWRSEERRSEPARPSLAEGAPARQPNGLAALLAWFGGSRRRPVRVGLLSPDWVATHGIRPEPAADPRARTRALLPFGMESWLRGQ